MAFDGIFTKAMAMELATALVGGRIQKIYQPEKDELLLHIQTKNGKMKLYGCVNTQRPGVYISEDNYTNPDTPTSLCMLLRKHLSGGIITEINQVDWERIIEVTIETKDEMGFFLKKILIFEIMGRHSNIILIDKNSKTILESVKRIPMDISRIRPIYPGLTYSYPPSQNKVSPNEISEENLLKITSHKDILENIKGISPILAKEIFYSKNRKDTLNRILENTKSPLSFVYFNSEKMPKDFHCTVLSPYEKENVKAFGSLSQCLEYFYKKRISSNRMRQKSTDLLKSLTTILKKLNLKKQRLLEDLSHAESQKDTKLLGELLTANLYKFQEGDQEVLVENYYDNSTMIITLDPNLSPSENAQKYYKIYNKSKRTIIEKTSQLENCNEEITYIESVLSHLERSTCVEDIDSIKNELRNEKYIKSKEKQITRKKKKNNIEPISYKTNSGSDVYVGRNNIENDALTFKFAGRNDIWLHTKDIPGSHVILKFKGESPLKEDLFEAASIAAFHSKGSSSENVPVDYTLVKHVKKPNGAKPGMVIFYHNKTLYVSPKIPQQKTLP